MPAKASRFAISLDAGTRELQPEADPSFGGIASLPGMTDELSSELRDQDMSIFGSNSGHFCFARVCSESFVSLRLTALQLLEEMK